MNEDRTNRYRGYPSVTEILQITGISNYPDNPRMKEAMERGTNVHLALAYDDKGILDAETLIPEYQGYVNSWRELKKVINPEIELIEQPLISDKHKFGGTIDRVMSYGGVRYIADFKTGGIYPSTAIQLAGYKILLRHSAQRIAIQLFKDGRIAKIHNFVEDSKDERTFMDALNRYYMFEQEESL